METLFCITSDCEGEMEGGWENYLEKIECPDCKTVYIVEFDEYFDSETLEEYQSFYVGVIT